MMGIAYIELQTGVLDDVHERVDVRLGGEVQARAHMPIGRCDALSSAALRMFMHVLRESIISYRGSRRVTFSSMVSSSTHRRRSVCSLRMSGAQIP